jgi:hypothetical protein
VVLWLKRRSYWLKKRYYGAAPDRLAVPPVPPVVPPPPPPPPVAAPPPRPIPEPEPDSDSSSSDGLIEIAPITVLQNDEDGDILLSPTTDERDVVANDMGGIWKFGRILQQTDVKAEDARPRIMPSKANYLFVRVDGTGNIDGVSYSSSLSQSITHNMKQVAVKVFDITVDSERERFRTEVLANRMAAMTRCSHIVPYLGNGERILNVRIHGLVEGQAQTYTSKHLYTEFAQCGDLEKLYSLHADVVDVNDRQGFDHSQPTLLTNL